MAEEILFVDDEEYILDIASQIFAERGLEILTSSSPADALEKLKRHEIAVLVSDNHMPGMRGIDLLSRVKVISPDTVKILMTGFADLETALEAINRVEVYRFLVKPWENSQLVAIVEEALEKYRLVKSILRGDENTMRSLVHALELKDPYTRGHSERVANYAIMIARNMGLNEEVLAAIRYGSWLHDCGKIGVSENILNNEGPLDDAEVHVIRNHPLWGADVARKGRLSRSIVNIILSHHERYDGKGYPAGLIGVEIPLEARIVSVADIYDALTTERPYRMAYTSERALEMLDSMRGNVLDPALVEYFSSAMKEMYA
ncbi:MAG TPA: HD domain-containing phosphohydrolase [Desulfomonilia bacterium]|jgi:putative nucleotidyltransferase with HDIG domain|nr:response regulator [Thermodesulfobacteriota bacterium]HWR67782.1 HD domain-containing phosphohydrolase [Desulfomonilia bacterium]